MLLLRIYDDMIALITQPQPDHDRIEKRDGDLARQLRRAACSSALNTKEVGAARREQEAQVRERARER